MDIALILLFIIVAAVVGGVIFRVCQLQRERLKNGVENDADEDDNADAQG